MNRRTVLKNIGLSFGALSMAPGIAPLLQSCESGPDWTPQFFSIDQAKILEELVELIIPETDLPGGKSLRLAPKIDAMVHLLADAPQQKLLLQVFDQFIEMTLADQQLSNENRIQPAALDAQLTKYLKASPEQQNKWAQQPNEKYDLGIEWDDDADSYLVTSKDIEDKLQVDSEKFEAEAGAFLFALEIRNITVQAYRTNEYIGKNVLAYAPIPGQQKGCVDLQETTGGMAWAL